MAITGKVYLVPNKQKNAWEVYVHNTGNQTVGVTQNIIPEQLRTQNNVHDDHLLNGHGLITNPGQVSRMSFFRGDTYVHQGYNGPHSSHTISEGYWLRLGFRGVASFEMQLPPLDSPAVEIDFDQFNWYGGNANTARMNTDSMAGYATGAKRRPESNLADGKSLIEQLRAVMALQQSGRVCRGEANITAMTDEKGQLSHWEMRFQNSGDVPWIGTASFVGANKRDGIGLESMACPDKDSAAVQRIELNGNYGTAAVAGAKVRLGVRGYAWTEIALPAQGTAIFPIHEFTLDTKQSSDEFFDHDKVTEKRQEKLNKVRFFQGGTPLNDEIKPIVRRGKEARTYSDFDPPKVVVTGAAHSDQTPGGGWNVEITNGLPATDERGELGFVATLKLDRDGNDPAQLPPKRFESPGATKTWFIPRDANINGVLAADGVELNVGTRGLGWYVAIPLPAAGQTVDTSEEKQFELWSFRDDQFNRQQLARDFTAKCRQ